MLQTHKTHQFKITINTHVIMIPLSVRRILSAGDVIFNSSTSVAIIQLKMFFNLNRSSSDSLIITLQKTFFLETAVSKII